MANSLIVTSQNIEGCEISNTLVKIQESIQKGNKNDQHIYGSRINSKTKTKTVVGEI